MSNLLKGVLNHGKELDKAELNEGEKHCEACSGVGIIKDTTTAAASFCSKCKGSGKLDWVEEIVGKQNKKNSPLDNVNVRMLVNYVQKELDNSVKDLMFEVADKQTMDLIEYRMSSVLDEIRKRNGIRDFQVQSSPGRMEILLKPKKTMEYIRLDIKLT